MEMDATSKLTTKKRISRGRVSRRRRKKLFEIQMEEAAAWETKTASETKSTTPTQQQPQNITAEEEANKILPADRSQVWPSVWIHRQQNEWKADDELALISQLGFVPGNVIRVMTRVKDHLVLENAIKSGPSNPEETDKLERAELERNLEREKQMPVVVQLYPIALRNEQNNTASSAGKKGRKRKRHQNDIKKDAAVETEMEGDGSSSTKLNSKDSSSLIEPFPTIYWLTHPLLRVVISKLEVSGLGTRLEQQLTSDPAALECLKRAHAGYGHERESLLLPQDKTIIRERQWEAAFATSRGVAGIRNPSAVKCLHAHAAHYLSGGSGSKDNLIGQWVMEHVQEEWKKKS